MSIADFDKLINGLKEDVKAGNVNAVLLKVMDVAELAQKLNKKELQYLHTSIRFKAEKENEG
jgi:hypothetical protein